MPTRQETKKSDEGMGKKLQFFEAVHYSQVAYWNSVGISIIYQSQNLEMCTPLSFSPCQTKQLLLRTFFCIFRKKPTLSKKLFYMQVYGKYPIFSHRAAQII